MSRLGQALRDRTRYGMGQIDDLTQANRPAEYGYFAGGQTGATVVTTDRIIFSTGVTAVFTTGNLPVGRGYGGYLSDKSTYGYFSGGVSGASTLTTIADRITFSTGTTAAFTAANMSQGRFLPASISDGLNYGYMLGGFSGSAVTTADRITFSTGTTAAFTAANLPTATYEITGISDASTYGYAAGGYTTAGTTSAYRLTFSTGTTASFTAANLTTALRQSSGLSDNTTYGYFAGGFTGADIVVTTANRITFSTGTTAAFTAANLSQARYGLNTTSDGNTYGYFAGGNTGIAVTTADRITFSTGTTAAYTTANLSQARFYIMSLADYAV